MRSLDWRELGSMLATSRGYGWIEGSQRQRGRLGLRDGCYDPDQALGYSLVDKIRYAEVCVSFKIA